MKLNYLLAICSQNKTAVISAAVLISSLVGGTYYASTPGGQGTIQQIIEPIPQVEVPADVTESEMTLAISSETEATVVITKRTTTPSTSKETTAAATTAKETTKEETQATTRARVKDASATTVQATVPVQTAAPTAAQTAAPTAAQTAAPTAAQTEAPTAPPPPATMGDTSGSFDSSMAQAVVDLVNQQRAAAGLPGLSWSGTLADSANIRAQEIVISWSHTRPDGSAWYTAGAQMQSGENLGCGQSSAQQAIDEWMASSGHAENILRGSFTQIGVSCYYCNGIYYWAQHFC